MGSGFRQVQHPVQFEPGDVALLTQEPGAGAQHSGDDVLELLQRLVGEDALRSLYLEERQLLRRAADVKRLLRRVPWLQVEPVERMRSQRQQVRILRNSGELRASKNLNRHGSLLGGQVQFHALREAREVGDDQQLLVFKLSNEGQHLAVAGIEKLEGAAPESLELLALLDQTLGEPEQGMRIVLLRFNVDGFVVVLGIDVDRQIQTLWVGAREAGVAVGAPLHGRADAVTVAEEN